MRYWTILRPYEVGSYIESTRVRKYEVAAIIHICIHAHVHLRVADSGSKPCLRAFPPCRVAQCFSAFIFSFIHFLVACIFTNNKALRTSYSWLATACVDCVSKFLLLSSFISITLLFFQVPSPNPVDRKVYKV